MVKFEVNCPETPNYLSTNYPKEWSSTKESNSKKQRRIKAETTPNYLIAQFINHQLEMFSTPKAVNAGKEEVSCNEE